MPRQNVQRPGPQEELTNTRYLTNGRDDIVDEGYEVPGCSCCLPKTHCQQIRVRVNEACFWVLCGTHALIMNRSFSRVIQQFSDATFY